MWGTSEDTATGDGTQTRSIGIVRQNNSGATQYQLEHRSTGTRATDGFGRPMGLITEQYSIVECYLIS